MNVNEMSKSYLEALVKATFAWESEQQANGVDELGIMIVTSTQALKFACGVIAALLRTANIKSLDDPKYIGTKAATISTLSATLDDAVMYMSNLSNEEIVRRARKMKDDEKRELHLAGRPISDLFGGITVDGGGDQREKGEDRDKDNPSS